MNDPKVPLKRLCKSCKREYYVMLGYAEHLSVLNVEVASDLSLAVKRQSRQILHKILKEEPLTVVVAVTEPICIPCQVEQAQEED